MYMWRYGTSLGSWHACAVFPSHWFSLPMLPCGAHPCAHVSYVMCGFQAMAKYDENVRVDRVMEGYVLGVRVFPM